MLLYLVKSFSNITVSCTDQLTKHSLMPLSEGSSFPHKYLYDTQKLPQIRLVFPRQYVKSIGFSTAKIHHLESTTFEVTNSIQKMQEIHS